MQLSLTKIFAAIAGIIALLHLKVIMEVIARVYNWFCDSLEPMRDFPEGMQATIAFCSILLIVVVLLKIYNKI